jgi:ABC-type proline/glycine betaine transport system ATPase subunit
MVFQQPVLLRRSANIMYALSLAGVRGERADARARALERVGLRAVAQQHARALSGANSSVWPLRAQGARSEVLFLDG